jgi:homoserine kinase
MSVKIFSPISIGNVSVGFDILGLAIVPIDGSLIGDIVHVKEAKESQDNDLIVIGSHADRLPKDKKSNIVWECIFAFNTALEKLGKKSVVVELILEKNIPSSSGLGSSACSVVAAIYALNEFYQRPFNEHQLLMLMVDLEAAISGSRHYDNVAPCYLGGLQLVVDRENKITQSLPIFEDCYWVMSYPDVIVSTKAAREILPKKIDMETSIKSGQNLAGFIDASYRQDKQQAFECLVDVIAEPHRMHLLPNFEQAKKTLMSLGCLAVGISGSGPTLFAVTDDLNIAEQSKAWLINNYLQTDQGFAEICKVDQQGTRQI